MAFGSLAGLPAIPIAASPSVQAVPVEQTKWMEYYRTQYAQLNQQAALQDQRAKQMDQREQMIYEREKKMWIWSDDLANREQVLGALVKERFQRRPYDNRGRSNSGVYQNNANSGGGNGNNNNRYDESYRQQQSQQYPPQPRDGRDYRYDTRAPTAPMAPATSFPKSTSPHSRRPPAIQATQSWYEASNNAPAAIVTDARNADDEYRPSSPCYNPTSPPYRSGSPTYAYDRPQTPPICGTAK